MKKRVLTLLLLLIIFISLLWVAKAYVRWYWPYTDYQSYIEYQQALRQAKEYMPSKTDTKTGSLFYSLIFALSLSGIIFFVLLFLYLWFLFGRDPKVNYNAIYEREPPYDYSPAVVSAILNSQDSVPSKESIVAVILDLCMKNFISLSEIKDKNGTVIDYKITVLKSAQEYESELDKGRVKKLPLDELTVLDWISKYSLRGQITFSELKRILDHPQNNDIIIWQRQVRNYVEKIGLYKDNWPLIIYYAFYFSFLVFISMYAYQSFFMGIGEYTGYNSSSLAELFLSLALLSIAVLVPFLLPKIFKQALIRRTELGVLHYQRWMNFKAFLEDFSSLRESQPTNIALWEKYLVYAIPLGVAKNVVKTMGIVFKGQEDILYEIASSYFNHLGSV
ncbi:MAG: DUF2207 domain-containing protein [Candidatus Diapherotrites archaeon]